MSAGTAPMSGGVSLLVGGASILYDIYDISKAKGESERKLLIKKRDESPKGSTQRKLLDEMIKELDQPRKRSRRTG